MSEANPFPDHGEIIEKPVIIPGLADAEPSDDLEDTKPRPALVMNVPTRWLSILVPLLGLLCTLVAVAWLVKTVLDAVGE